MRPSTACSRMFFTPLRMSFMTKSFRISVGAFVVSGWAFGACASSHPQRANPAPTMTTPGNHFKEGLRPEDHVHPEGQRGAPSRLPRADCRTGSDAKAPRPLQFSSLQSRHADG